MTETKTTSSTRRKPRRRQALLIVIAIFAVLFGSYHFMTRSSRVTVLATQVLTRLTGARVRVQSATFSINGQVVLNHVNIDAPDASGPGAQIFEADKVVIHYSRPHLLIFKFVAIRIEIPQPIINVTYDRDRDLYNFRYHIVPGEDVTSVPQSIPQVELPDGTLRFGEVIHGQYVDRGQLPISGHIKASDEVIGISSFELRQEGVGQQLAPTIEGVIDLRQPSISAQLTHLTNEIFDSTQGRVILGPLHEMWQQMNPTGSLPQVNFGYDPDPNVGFYASLIVDDIALSIPFTDRENRISNVAGHFAVDNNQVSPDLKGKVSTAKFDFDYQINGHLQGFSADTPFDFSIHTDGVIKEMTEEEEDLWPLPDAIQRIFRLYGVTGGVKAHVKTKREEPDLPVLYDGTVFLYDAKGKFAKFPYPLKDLNGELRFNETKIELVSIRGNGPNGGNVIITGEVKPPRRHAGTQLTITGADVPLDRLLFDAIPPKAQPMLQLFLDDISLKRLYELGVVQSKQNQQALNEQLLALKRQLRDLQQEQQGDEPEAKTIEKKIQVVESQINIPIFELGGKVDVEAKVDRPEGEGKKYTTISTVDLTGVNLLCRFWPYPLRVRSGRIIIGPKRVEVLDIEFEGLDGGAGTVTGTVDLPVDGGQLIPDLEITAGQVPIDDLLLASIPHPHDQLLRDQHIQGHFDAKARVFRREGGKVDFQVDAIIKDATAQPYNGDFILDHVSGGITLKHNDVTVNSLVAQRKDATFNLNGHAMWVDDKAILDLAVAARGLHFDDPILDLMRHDDPVVIEARKTIESYQPTGEFDADLEYRLREDQSAEYQLQIKPKQLAFNLHDKRIEMKDITGRAVITPGLIELDQLAAKFGADLDGWVQGSGQVNFGEQVLIDVKFTGGSPIFDETTMAMLPDNVADIIEQIKLECAFDIHQGQLKIAPDQDNQYVVDFYGDVHITDANAFVGVPVTELNSRMAIEAHHKVTDEYPKMNIDVDADSLRLIDRLIQPLTLTLQSSTDGAIIKINNIQGTCYGGMLTGQGNVQLDRDNLTQMHLTLVDSELGQFLDPIPDTGESQSKEKKNETPESIGKISTNISIEVQPADPNTRRGRGQIEVRDAQLYQFPLSVAIMQIVNLTLPSSRSFDQATVSYLINGDDILLDKVSLRAPTLEIVGKGTMKYSTLELDLDLVSRNPANFQMGAVSELFDVFKDELISIKVTGTVNDPVAEGQTLSGISDSLKDIFGEDPNPPAPKKVAPAHTGQAEGENKLSQ